MAEDYTEGFENGRIFKLEGLVTLTLTLDPEAVAHTFDGWLKGF